MENIPEHEEKQNFRTGNVTRNTSLFYLKQRQKKICTKMSYTIIRHLFSNSLRTRLTDT